MHKSLSRQRQRCCNKNEDEAEHHHHDECEWRTKYEQASKVLEATKASLAAAQELIRSFEKASSCGSVDCQSETPMKTPFLPAEMWMKIFGFITKPQDYLNCSNTCVSFQDLMAENKVATLLPSVIQILSEHQKHYTPPKFTNGVQDQREGVGNSRGNIDLEPEDLRNCRLVCRSWRGAINKHISNHPSIENLFLKRGFEEINYAKRFGTLLPIVLHVDNPEKIKKMLTYLESDRLEKCNVLLSSRHVVIRGLQLLTYYEEENKPKKHPILTLFEKVGSSIWHLAVDNENDEFENPNATIEWYQALVQCLNLIPNLKSLVIFQANCTADVKELSKAKTRAHPIPHFSDLKVVQLDHVSENLYKSLFKSNGHIKKLRLSLCGTKYSGCPHANFWNNADLTRNLTEFSLGIYVEDFDDIIGTLKRVKWPLTKFNLDGHPVCGQALFKALERFRHTLTHLCISNILSPRVKIMAPFPHLGHMELYTKSVDDESWYGLEGFESEEEDDDVWEFEEDIALHVEGFETEEEDDGSDVFEE